METIEIGFDNFLITRDQSKMDMVAIHDFLSKQSGWSIGIPFDKVKISIEKFLKLWPFSPQQTNRVCKSNFRLFDHCLFGRHLRTGGLSRARSIFETHGSGDESPQLARFEKVDITNIDCRLAISEIPF